MTTALSNLGEGFRGSIYLWDDFSVTSQMQADPVVKYFLENFWPKKLDWKKILAGEISVIIEDEIQVYPEKGTMFWDSFITNYPFVSLLTEIEEDDELYLLPIVPENLSRRVLFPRKIGTRGEWSKLEAKIVKIDRDEVVDVLLPEKFYFHSGHFISPEKRAGYVEGLGKSTKIPFEIEDSKNRVGEILDDQ